jgi:hypothetical protein
MCGEVVITGTQKGEFAGVKPPGECPIMVLLNTALRALYTIPLGLYPNTC